jgi:hypothetical protein
LLEAEASPASSAANDAPLASSFCMSARSVTIVNIGPAAAAGEGAGGVALTIAGEALDGDPDVLAWVLVACGALWGPGDAHAAAAATARHANATVGAFERNITRC